MSADRLDEIKARAEAATPGPWLQDGPWWTDDGGSEPTALPCVVDANRALVVFPPDATDVGMKRPEDRAANMAFIAAAREDVPWLVSEVARLTAELAEVKRTYTPCDLDLLTERDALAAQVARVEALAEEWRYKGQFGWGPWQIGEGPDPEGYVMDHCASALRAVLAGSEADTTDTQPTDPGCGCSTNPARARHADGDPAGCYCTCSDDAREGCEHE